MEGNKRSHFLHLCGQLLRLVLIPCHVEGELHPWTRSTALSFAAEIDGHVLGTLCAVTMIHNGVAHQPARSVHPRAVRSRQVEIDGNPHPGLD